MTKKKSDSNGGRNHDHTDRERFMFYKQKGVITESEEERVSVLVGMLIRSLYIPILGFGDIIKTDPQRAIFFGVDRSEPINWNNLRCDEVCKVSENHFVAIISEAAPHICFTFCAYIEKYMKGYGWNVKVRTKW